MNIQTRDAARTDGAVVRHFCIAIAICILLPTLHATELRAQVVPLPTPAGFEQPSGLTIGSFDLYGRIQAGLAATENVRLDPTEESDIQKILAVNLVARSNWKKHALAGTLSFLKKQAVDITDQKQEARSGTISGRIDFSEEVNLRLGALSEESAIGKDSPLQFSGNLNGTTQINTLEAALGWDDKIHFVNLLSRYQDISNSTDIEVTVLSRVQNQDRKEYNATLQAGWHLDWGQAYLFGGPQRVTYTGSAVILPEDRDSKGGRFGVGAEFKHGDFNGVVRIIGFAQYFNAPTIDDMTSIVGTARLTYKIDDQWSAAGVIERNFEETNIETSGGLYTNIAALGAIYAPRKDFYVKAGPVYRFYQIDGTRYEAKSYTLDVTAAWQANPHVELLFNSSVSNQTVNDTFLAEQKYGDASATLSVVITF